MQILISDFDFQRACWNSFMVVLEESLSIIIQIINAGNAPFYDVNLDEFSEQHSIKKASKRAPYSMTNEPFFKTNMVQI